MICSSQTQLQSRILQFLSVPASSRRLDCAVEGRYNLSQRRGAGLITSPYTERAVREVEQNIAAVQRLLASHGHPALPVHLYTPI